MSPPRGDAVTVPWDDAGRVLGTGPGPRAPCVIKAILCPSSYSPGSLLGDIRPTEMRPLLEPALPSAGQGPALSPPGPALASSNDTISHFSFLRCLPMGGCVCACVRVYVPFRAGENPYSLSSDRINQINLLEGAAK